jgi:hypothetical protein
MYPKHFFARQNIREEKGLVFVLIPFASAFLPIFTAIRDVVQEGLGMRCVRADDLYTPEPIMEAILRGIGQAEIVIADLTGRNANVFYELGVTHALKDRCIILSQNIDDH